ncbi:MAG: thiamine/thiamine pyrophosphate ABC transporter permease [Arenicellales bacterium]
MPGLVAAVLVALTVIGALCGLAIHAGNIPLLEQLGKSYTWSIIRFTFAQAALSTLFSVVLAVPLARALYRRQHFFGRELLIRFTSISLIVPTMVAVLGIIAVHGRNGWINDLLTLIGFSRQDYLYGLNGILIAHVFFNLPLVTRLFLNGLSDIPAYQWKLATLLGFNSRQNFKLIEWPAIRGLVPGATGIVFLLCFTSFAIVLSLGGGPGSTTLEVAIYQAIRFDFDLSKAVALSLIQIGLCLVLAFLFFSKQPVLKLQSDQPPGVDRPDSGQVMGIVQDNLVISLAAIFLVSPFAAVLINSLSGNGWVILADQRFWRAFRSSIFISLSAGMLATILGLSIAHLIAKLRHNQASSWLGTIPELVGMLTLLIPPITLGTGLFLLFRSFTDALSLGQWLVILINALFTLAFTLRILVAPVQQQHNRFLHLSRSLGVTGWNQWQLVLWPTLKKPICYAMAVSTTLSAGDMGVIALFGTDRLSTLPLLIYRLLGNYRLDQAAVVAICLCTLCLFLFWSIEKLAHTPAGFKSHA